MKEDWNSRTKLLLGDKAVAKLQGSHVLIVGIGGVGAAATEMLARAGIGKMTLVDGDVVNDSNRNRQLNALTSTIGRPKVQVMEERIRDINPDLEVKLIQEFITDEKAEALVKSASFQFVVDAIDTLAPKISLLYHCLANNIPVISAMGAGGKTDSALIRQTDISKTTQCPLAKIVRRELRLRGINSGLPVVFSPEPIDKETVLPVSGERNKRSTVGTISYMPVLFGCHMAAYVIKELTLIE